MRDYLNDLVTKNFGTANVIQPRKPTHFEPVQKTGAVDAEIERLPPESFEETQIIEPIQPVRARRGREIKVKVENEIISNRDDSNERIAETRRISPPENHSPEIAQRNSNSDLKPKAFETIQESPSRNLSVAKTAPNNISESFTLQMRLKAAVKQEKSAGIFEPAPVQTHLEPIPKNDESKLLSPESFERQIGETKTSIIPESQIEKTDNRAAEAVIHQNVFPLIHKQISKQTSESPEKTAETPVINVTIGRVEIRAVASSAPPVKETSAKSPTLSLDEYLRKRHAGGGQ